MRRAVAGIAIGAGVLLVAGIAATFLIDANQFRPGIESELTRSLGREVKIGNLKFSFFSGTAAASDLSVADDPAFSQKPFLQARALQLSVNPWQALFSHKLNIHGATIENPEVVLIQAPSGSWNFSTLGAGAKPSAAPQPSNAGNSQMAVSIKSLKIENARLSITNAPGKPKVLDNVNVELTDFVPGAAFPFSLSAKIAGGGDISATGRVGPINPADTANSPLAARLKIANLNLVASGAVPNSSGIDGLLSLDGNLQSDGRSAEVTGTVRVDKVKLAAGGTPARNPLLFTVALTEDLRTHAGQMSRGDVAIGSAKASITGTWSEQGELTVLNMRLTTPDVPVAAVQELLPSLDIVLPSGSALEGGTAATSLALTGPLSAIVTSGSVRVQNTRLKGFDLATKMSQIAALAGIRSGPITEIQTLSANIRVAPEGTSIQDIRMVLPAIGGLTGGGTVSPGRVLALRMRATVRPGMLVSTLAPSTIGFLIGGTASNPQFQPDVAQLATEEINKRLKGLKIGGVDAGQAADSVLQGLFGGKKKK